LFVSDLTFEWDSGKDAANQRKHGVTFAEAQTAFLDEHALLIADPDHSVTEDRFVLLGLSSALNVLVVCHCHRRRSVIRIISARKAKARERAEYQSRWAR
jgi:uncharacterized protein